MRKADTVHVVISCLAHLWLATGWFLIEHLINPVLFSRRYIWMQRAGQHLGSPLILSVNVPPLVFIWMQLKRDFYTLTVQQQSIFSFSYFGLFHFFQVFFFQHVDQRNPGETSLFLLSAPHPRCECMREACRGKRRSPVMLCMHPKERRQIKTTLFPSVYPKVFRGKIKEANFPEREEAGCGSLPRQL